MRHCHAGQKTRSGPGFFMVFLALIQILLISTPSHGQKASLSAPGPKTLINALKGKDSAKKNQAMEYIKENKPGDLLPILSSLAHKSWNEKDRNMALTVIKMYPPDTAVPFLVDVLEKTDSQETKIKLIDYLSPFNDRRSVIPIAKELKNPFQPVREAAARGLKYADDRVYPVILEMAESPNPVMKLYALQAFNYLYDRRFYNTIISLLEDENKSIRIYAVICLETNKLGQSAPQLRAMALNDKNDEVRIEAIRTIGSFGDRNSLPALYVVLNDANKDVRKASISAMETIGEKKSSYPLSDRLARESDDEIKKSLIDAMVSLKSGGSLAGLKKILLEDKKAGLRIDAAYALGWIKDSRGLPILLEALDDADFRVRAEASAAAGNFRDRSASASLIEVVSRDRERYVRSAALYALKKINDRKSVIPLFDIYSTEKDPVFREQMRSVIRSYLEKLT